MILSHVSCPNKFSGVARTFGRSDLGLGEVHLNFVPSLLLFSYKSCHGMCKTNTSLLVCSPCWTKCLFEKLLLVNAVC